MGNICYTDTTQQPEIYDLIQPTSYPQSFEKLKKLEITSKQELIEFLEQQATQIEIKDETNSTESFENSKYRRSSLKIHNNNNPKYNIENQNFDGPNNNYDNNQTTYNNTSYQKIIINLDHKYISQQLMNKLSKFLLLNQDLVHLELNFNIYFENNLKDQQVFENLQHLPYLHYLDFNIQLNESEYVHQNFFPNLEKILLYQKNLRVLILNLKECQLNLEQTEMVFNVLKKLKFLKNLHLIFDKNNIIPLLKSENFLHQKSFKNLNYLELSFQRLKEKLSQEDMEVLGLKLQSLKEIKQVQIDLSKNSLKSENLVTFLQNLKKLENIDNLSLNISQNNLNKTIIPIFKNEIKQCKSLQTVQLNVSQNPKLDMESSNQLLEDDMVERFQSIHVITEAEKKQ